jgi:hypothetical protein
MRTVAGLTIIRTDRPRLDGRPYRQEPILASYAVDGRG